MLSISLAHNWMDLTILLMDMIQSFVQAVPPSAEAREASELMQLPGVTFDSATELIKSDDKWGPFGLQGLWKMSDGHRKKVLGVGQAGKMDAATYAEMMRVLGEWPRIELLDAFFKVTGEKIVTPGAIVHYIVKMRTLPLKKDGTILHAGIRPGSDINRREEESSVRPSTEDDDETKLENLIGRGDPKNIKEGKQALGFARAPYFLEERKPAWWVFISDSKQSRIIVQPVKCTDVGPDMTRTFSIQFQAPPQPGLYTFRAIIKSDCYLASEAEMSVLLKVEDASNLEEGDFEDDISEPDEDTLAGQMAAMRGDKVKSPRGHHHGHNHSHGHKHDEEDDEDESGTDDGQGEGSEAEDSESDWE
jgi:translocation protein SEC63